MQALDVHAFVRSKELLIFHKTKVDILVSGAVVSQGFHIMMECYELIADYSMPSGYPRSSITLRLSLKSSSKKVEEYPHRASVSSILHAACLDANCQQLLFPDSNTLHPKTLMLENHSSAETKHFSTRSTKLGFSNAAATLSLSFNCLLTAAPQSKPWVRMRGDYSDKR